MQDAGRSNGPSNLIPAAIAIVLLLMAAFHRFPYSFYVLLRVAVCGVSLYYASHAHASQRTAWVWLFAASAIVFNPVIPLRMARSDWRVLNLVDAVVFSAWVVTMWRSAQSRRGKTRAAGG